MVKLSEIHLVNFIGADNTVNWERTIQKPVVLYIFLLGLPNNLSTPGVKV